MSESYECKSCHQVFKTQRGLNCHISKSSCSQEQMKNSKIKNIITNNGNENTEDLYIPSALEDGNMMDELVFPPNCDPSLLQQAMDHEKNKCYYSDNIFKAGIELLNLLKDAKAPLYLFDGIIKWIKKSIYHYNIDFHHLKGFSRDILLQKAKKQYDLSGLSPKIMNMRLNGIHEDVEIVVHDFKQCLYSLLKDKNLMCRENLLLSEENNELSYYPPRRQDVFDDINSGKCYKMAFKKYINDPSKELLCPIIFFIDKTHTDIHGRLCLEPVQFTLGIFNRETRGKAHAWRTLGYIPDLQKKEQDQVGEKMQDYHDILSIILKTFNDAQRNPIIWRFCLNDGIDKFYALKIPILFIIGDTEGHDKLCGRYSFRKNPYRLCRYCNVSFEETDDPYTKYEYTRQSEVISLITSQNTTALKHMSMHCIKNAWHNLDFCDYSRGIHGATLAEVLHCIQQGLFEYAIKGLFEQRKYKKSPKRNITKMNIIQHEADSEEEAIHEEDDSSEIRENDDESNEEDIESTNSESESIVNDEYEDMEDEMSSDDDELIEIDSTNSEFLIDEDYDTIEHIIYNYSRNYVFPKSYCGIFESLCRKFGKILQHQSDRHGQVIIAATSPLPKRMDMKWQV